MQMNRNKCLLCYKIWIFQEALPLVISSSDLETQFKIQSDCYFISVLLFLMLHKNMLKGLISSILLICMHRTIVKNLYFAFHSLSTSTSGVPLKTISLGSDDSNIWYQTTFSPFELWILVFLDRNAGSNSWSQAIL